MNTKTFKRRISFAYTQKGTLKNRFSGAIRSLKAMAEGEKIYPYNWKRSKGHCNLRGESEAYNTAVLCHTLGLELMWGNDAPRGGISGNYMYLQKKDIAKLKNVDFEQIK